MSETQAKENMIKQQLRPSNILDESLFALYDRYPRHAFVPKDYQNFAYADTRLPLAHKQTMLTPLEEAQILQALDIKQNETVLEVGTGSGYLTALLAHFAKKVTSIEYFDDLSKHAEAVLAEQKISNVELKVGNAARGWMEGGPYDVIVITGGINELGDHFRPQLMKGGRLFAIVGETPAMQACLFHLDQAEKWHKTVLFDTTLEHLINSEDKKNFIF